MREKTAAEKLREELEGSPEKQASEQNSTRSDLSRMPASRPRHSRSKPRKLEKPENVGQRIDSFMEDFERMVAESLNTVKAASTQSQPSSSNVEESVNSEEYSAATENDASEEVVDSLKKELESVPEAESPEPVLEIESTEPTLEIESPEPVLEIESTPEPALEVESTEPTLETESPEPTLEVESTDETSDADSDSDDSFPDIPVIDAELSDPSDELPDIPVISSDLDTLDDSLDSQPSDLPASSPAADLVVSVDDDLPQISTEAFDLDPETETSPVSITMPEETKTAEDKLMADIAEAMTGTPLTLDSTDDAEPYRLPDDFFAANHDSPAESAEGKLIADINQALTESPIGIAQDNASQNLEADLNPFDEMPMPSPVSSFSIDDEPEEIAEDEPFLPDFSASQEQPEASSEDDNDEALDPFSIPDFDDEPESQYIDDDSQPDTLDNEQEPDSQPYTLDDEPEPDSQPDAPDEQEPDSQPYTLDDEQEPDTESQDFDDINTDIDDDITAPEPDSKPDALTAEERLAQDLAASFQQDIHDTSSTDNAPETDSTYTDLQQEEEDIHNNMPEQNLLEDIDPAPDVEDDDDAFDMSQFGEAASIYDDADTSHDEQDTSLDDLSYSDSEPETESYFAASTPLNAAEEADKEKTMSIRDKLKGKKNGISSGGFSLGGGMITNILLGLLLIVGALLLWQMFSMSDKLALSSMSPEALAEISTPERYEYAIDFILDPNMTERMAARGREGWQIVGSRRTQDSTSGQYGYEFIFMRRAGR